MRIIKLLALFFLSFYSIQHANAENFSSYRNVGEIKVDQANLIRIKAGVGEKWIDNQQCNGSNETSQVYLDLSNEAGKAMYSLILSAKMANQPIAFWFDGCKKLWDINTPIVVSAYIS
ncbi:hypothetical protein [Photobacterium rosenbergii]|uniref:Uncharacterized protein n=1 Tax=Photobacterium rosenbergii TaxID=294936 RepID=A0ABU3ZE01_9GAMM|nr:hypothetical protein [Photobacterium rosenbergii]MDV5168327.1 hypothetical protein [Photobacterium rosenbergii]